MKRKFVTNLALLLFLNFLVKPFWFFGIEITVQNTVGAEDYGFYFSLFNFSMLLNIILDLGITNYNNRNIAQHSQLLSKHVSNIVVLKFLLAIVYFIISVSAALIIGYEWAQMKLLFFLIFNQFLISFVLYLRSNLSGLHLFKTDSLISVLDRTLMIIICGVLLWGNVTDKPFEIAWFVYAQTAAYLFTALITFFAVWAKTDFLRLNFDRNFFIVFLKQSYPYALLVLLMSFYNRIDSVMLERMLTNGKEQAGIYAQAFRMLEVGTMYPFLFSSLLLPIFAKMLKTKESVSSLVQLSYLLLIIPAVIVAFAAFFYRNEIIELMYHSHIDASANILSILMFSFIAMSTSYIFGTLLTSNGNMKQLNIMAGVGMVLNIVLNLILIPTYQAYGSAIASLVTQFFTAASQVLIAKNIFKLKVNYSVISRLFIFVAVLYMSGILLIQYIDHWIVSIIVFVAVGGALSLLLKLFNIKDMYHLIRSDEE